MEIIFYSDGGARGNPGPAAYGFLVYQKPDVLLYKEGKTLGNNTNNVAEYTGVLQALTWIKNNINTPLEKITGYLDSELIVKQLSGEYRVKNDTLKELFANVKQQEAHLAVPIRYIHVPRAQNKEADALVNQALDNAPHF